MATPTPSPDGGSLKRVASFQGAQPSCPLDEYVDSNVRQVASSILSSNPGSIPLPSLDSSSSDRQAKPLIRPFNLYMNETVLPNFQEFKLKELNTLYEEWSYRLEKKRRKNEISLEKIQKLAGELEKTFNAENQQILGREIRQFQIAEKKCEQIEADCEYIERKMDQLEGDQLNLNDIVNIQVDQLPPNKCKKLLTHVTERLTQLFQELESTRSNLRRIDDKLFDRNVKRTKKNDGHTQIAETIREEREECSARMDTIQTEESQLRKLHEALSTSKTTSSVAYRKLYQDLIPQLNQLTLHLRF